LKYFKKFTKFMTLSNLKISSHISTYAYAWTPDETTAQSDRPTDALRKLNTILIIANTGYLE